MTLNRNIPSPAEVRDATLATARSELKELQIPVEVARVFCQKLESSSYFGGARQTRKEMEDA